MSSASPRVSVILPTYQRAGLVLEALASVFAQTLEDHEVLLVDDGSTDGTGDAVRARFPDDPRLRVLTRPNGGAAAARNLGLEHARGTYVAFLDSDDLFEPDHLACLVARLETTPDAAVAVCDARYEGGGKHTGRTVFSRSSFRPPVDLDRILDGAWALPSCLMVRRSAAPDVRFDETFPVVEDVEFIARLYARGLHGVLEPRVLTRYRKLAPQATDDELRIQEGMLRVLERYADHSNHPRRHAVQRARRRARVLVAQGRWAEARPYLLAWLRGRPGLAPLRLLLVGWRRRGAQAEEPHDILDARSSSRRSRGR